MKKSLVLAGLLLTSSTVMATETQWFVGLGISKMDTSVKESVTGSVAVNGTNIATAAASASTDIDDTALGIKAGVIVDAKHRVSIENSKYDFDYSSEARKTTLSYDYIIDIDSEVRPFIGAHVGHLKVQAYNLVEDSGMLYGAQVGVLYDITKNIELEAGVSASATSVAPSISGAVYNDGTVAVSGTYKMDVSTIVTMGASINYKF